MKAQKPYRPLHDTRRKRFKVRDREHVRYMRQSLLDITCDHSRRAMDVIDHDDNWVVVCADCEEVLKS